VYLPSLMSASRRLTLAISEVGGCGSDGLSVDMASNSLLTEPFKTLIFLAKLPAIAASL
jgi:hypothetical protein